MVCPKRRKQTNFVKKKQIKKLKLFLIKKKHVVTIYYVKCLIFYT